MGMPLSKSRPAAREDSISRITFLAFKLNSASQRAEYGSEESAVVRLRETHEFCG